MPDDSGERLARATRFKARARAQRLCSKRTRTHSALAAVTAGDCDLNVARQRHRNRPARARACLRLGLLEIGQSDRSATAPRALNAR